MALAPYPRSDQSNPAQPHSTAPQAEIARLRAEIDRLQAERTAITEVLGNDALQASERIVAVFTLFEVAHARSAGQGAGDWTPICAKAIAGRAGVSSDTAEKVIERLSKLGAWTKQPAKERRSIQDQDGNWSTPLVVHTPAATVLESLAVVAQLAPTTDARKEATGRGKPGSRPGTYRKSGYDEHMVPVTCPECGSTSTRLQCMECGTVTPTEELIRQNDATNGGYPQVAATPPEASLAAPDAPPEGVPVSCGSNTLEKVPVSCGYPPYEENTGCVGIEAGPTCFLKPIVGNIPQTLLNYRQWVAWRHDREGGRAVKVPINPHTGMRAKCNDPATWGSIYQALDALNQYTGDGLMFALTADDPITAIDFDTMSPETLDALAALDSYSERSPSERGAHVLVIGTKPGDRSKCGMVEIYNQNRFITITGHLLDGRGVIRERQAALDALYRQTFAERPKSTIHAPAAAPTSDDAELLRKAMNAANGADFVRLWHGDTNGYASKSEADWSLLLRLRYWTRSDAESMDRLYRQSGLYDPSDWDRPESGGTHGEREVARCIEKAYGHDA